MKPEGFDLKALRIARDTLARVYNGEATKFEVRRAHGWVIAALPMFDKVPGPTEVLDEAMKPEKRERVVVHWKRKRRNPGGAA